VRGLWHGVLALFGIGKKRRDSETIIEEERYTRRGSTHSRRDAHGSWYGGRPSTVAARKEKSKGAGLLGLGAALGTLALLLGLRRDKKEKKTVIKERSDISSSYYTDSYTATSPSMYFSQFNPFHKPPPLTLRSTGSRSSDRRTRHSRPSRAPSASRVTRETHTRTRRVSRAPSARSPRSPR
jgi:hypothetical protein